MNSFVSLSDTTYNQIYSKLIEDDFESNEFNENRYKKDEIDFYWDIRFILKANSNKYTSNDEQLKKMTVSLDKIDSLYSNDKLIHFLMQ